MESLTCLIGREGYQVLSWMPGRIDTGSYYGTVLHLNFMCLTILYDYSTSVVSSDVEHHICRTIATIVMAVDTMIDFIIELTVVLVNSMDIPVGQVTLIDTKLTIQLVTGRDKSVA